MLVNGTGNFWLVPTREKYVQRLVFFDYLKYIKRGYFQWEQASIVQFMGIYLIFKFKNNENLTRQGEYSLIIQKQIWPVISEFPNIKIATIEGSMLHDHDSHHILTNQTLRRNRLRSLELSS